MIDDSERLTTFPTVYNVPTFYYIPTFYNVPAFLNVPAFHNVTTFRNVLTFCNVSTGSGQNTIWSCTALPFDKGIYFVLNLLIT